MNASNIENFHECAECRQLENEVNGLKAQVLTLKKLRELDAFVLNEIETCSPMVVGYYSKHHELSGAEFLRDAIILDTLTHGMRLSTKARHGFSLLGILLEKLISIKQTDFKNLPLKKQSNEKQ